MSNSRERPETDYVAGTEVTPAPSSGRNERQSRWVPLGTLAAYVLFRWSLAVIQLPDATPRWVLLVAAVLSAAGAIGLPILGIVSLVRRPPSTVGALGLGAAGLAVWLGLAAARLSPGLAPLSGAVQDLGKILAAAGVGVALSAALREPNILLPAGIFAAFADFVVVNFGTVKHALSSPKGQAMVQAVSAQVPAVHPRLAALTIGPADFLFLGIFVACAARFGMGVGRTAWILAVVLALSLVLVPLIGPIPALAPMATAFVVTNWRHFRLSRQELLSTLVVLVFMGGLFLTYFLFLFPKKR